MSSQGDPGALITLKHDIPIAIFIASKILISKCWFSPCAERGAGRTSSSSGESSSIGGAWTRAWPGRRRVACCLSRCPAWAATSRWAHCPRWRTAAPAAAPARVAAYRGCPARTRSRSACSASPAPSAAWAASPLRTPSTSCSSAPLATRLSSHQILDVNAVSTS